MKAIYVEVGQKVQRNQLLARVDATSARQGLRTALASLASARAAYATTTQGQTAQEHARDQQSINVSARSVQSARVSLRSARQTYALDRSQQNAAVTRAEQAVRTAKLAAPRPSSSTRPTRRQPTCRLSTTLEPRCRPTRVR